jgi:hypothetical protein
MKVGLRRFCDSCEIELTSGQRIISKTKVMCKECYDKREERLEQKWREQKHGDEPV